MDKRMFLAVEAILISSVLLFAISRPALAQSRRGSGVNNLGFSSQHSVVNHGRMSFGSNRSFERNSGFSRISHNNMNSRSNRHNFSPSRNRNDRDRRFSGHRSGSQNHRFSNNLSRPRSNTSMSRNRMGNGFARVRY